MLIIPTLDLNIWHELRLKCLKVRRIGLPDPNYLLPVCRSGKRSLVDRCALSGQVAVFGEEQRSQVLDEASAAINGNAVAVNAFDNLLAKNLEPIESQPPSYLIFSRKQQYILVCPRINFLSFIYVLMFLSFHLYSQAKILLKIKTGQ